LLSIASDAQRGRPEDGPFAPLPCRRSRYAAGFVLNGGVIFFSSCRSVRDLDDLLFGRSRRRQPLAESLHRAADDRLGEFGVVARHVGVRVPENLGQHVDRHSVFDGHAGEGVAGHMHK